MDAYAEKKVVVTGGTHGMGLATVKALLDGGAEVMLTGRNEQNIETARAELGERARVVRSDVASMTDIEALATQVAETLGQIDLLFVNAGYARLEPFAQMSEAVYDHMFDVNAKARSSQCSTSRRMCETVAQLFSPPRSPMAQACQA